MSTEKTVKSIPAAVAAFVRTLGVLDNVNGVDCLVIPAAVFDEAVSDRTRTEYDDKLVLFRALVDEHAESEGADLLIPLQKLYKGEGACFSEAAAINTATWQGTSIGARLCAAIGRRGRHATKTYDVPGLGEVSVIFLRLSPLSAEEIEAFHKALAEKKSKKGKPADAPADAPADESADDRAVE